ncbi:SRPBCC family protein [Flavivirga jejuensis]|uniref:SRPBCC domain-containing protein n=1 Tax=Flavivirga jejuensis TaxID=870487 RepID=A0ABT8WPH8_9FLAO|nr:SRPBCC domain-containing protein [Flavivirga jejuensis]MDO5975067.1 SRPBCC domain-containing protein [Flavivirga jejuensis]
MSKTNDASNRTVTIKRTFNAPIELVWEAWTQPEHIIKWWGHVKMNVKVIQHNFKVGGTWKYTMEMPDGNEFITEGVYSEIVEFEKIISSADFKPMTEGVEIQAFFEKNGDQTNFTFNIVHDTEEYCKQQEKMGILNGWGSVFDRLVEHLETLVK